MEDQIARKLLMLLRANRPYLLLLLGLFNPLLRKDNGVEDYALSHHLHDLIPVDIPAVSIGKGRVKTGRFRHPQILNLVKNSGISLLGRVRVFILDEPDDLLGPHCLLARSGEFVEDWLC